MEDIQETNLPSFEVEEPGYPRVVKNIQSILDKPNLPKITRERLGVFLEELDY